MKRDMDLARTILVALENEQAAFRPKDFSVNSWSDEEVSYHVKLLHEAGLIEAVDIYWCEPIQVVPDVLEMGWPRIS